MKLVGNIALVTGGASGMGAATVAMLRAAGMRVAVWDRVQAPEADYALTCDVVSEEAVSNALSATILALGVPRLVVNCAGIAPASRLVGKSGPHALSLFKDVIDVNLIGTFNVMRFVASELSKLEPFEAERGVIINTASIAAFEGQIGQMAYSASKGAIVSMTLPAARELAAFAIRVNTIAPGLIHTPLFNAMTDEVKDALASTVSFPKRLGRPDEFAALVVHIAENEYINGEVIRLDGGLRMQAR